MVELLFAQKRFLDAQDIDYVRSMKLEWKLIRQSFGIGKVWLECPTCEAVSAFSADEVGEAFTVVRAAAPFLKCEACTFQPFLPEIMLPSESQMVVLVVKGDQQGEVWSDIDRDPADEEDHRAFAFQRRDGRKNSRRHFPVPRPP